MRVNRPFADCKDDELHLADAIQSFGSMVVLDQDDTVVATSANSAAFLGVTPQELLGTDARRTLRRELDLDAVRADAAATRPEEGEAAGPIRPHLRQVELRGRPTVVAVHERDGRTIVEVQAVDDGDGAHVETAGTVQRLTDRLEGAGSPEQAAGLLVDAVAALTGFDRVLAYRFLPGWHGEVVDEHLAPGTTGYRGLRFPESDVPANARRLYLAKRQRIIADVASATVPVYGVRAGMKLDLTGSELRAVHPTHITYLEHMGVAASFSLSIVVEGRLWGLIACHHRTVRRLGLRTRQACELVASIASLQIANLERVQSVRATDRHVVALDRTWAELERSEEPQVRTVLPGLREAFGAEGVVGRVRGRTCSDGDVPTGATFERLREVCDAWPSDAATATSRIPEELAEDPEAVRVASGILHVPVRADGYVTFLRREQDETVAWAGRPPHAEGPDGRDPSAAPLSPRTSFEIWREAAHGQATPWSDVDLEAAERLREALVEWIERVDLEHRASTDELTGLANRAAFDDALAEAIADADRASSALVLVDLDHFKEVNDTFGHLVGDELLHTVAERLRDLVRTRDLAARLGGDEFALILRDVPDRAALEVAAARVVRALGATHELADERLDVPASVGAAFVSDGTEVPEAVIARADEALYAAKRAGRGRYVIAGDGSSADGSTASERT